MAIGAVAAGLLFAGGLKALQTASIVAALPFSFVVILSTYCFVKALRQEPLAGKAAGYAKVVQATEQTLAVESAAAPSSL